MTAKRKGYFQVDNQIFDNDTLELGTYDKIVYIYLSRCGNQGARAFPSYKTIGKKCGMHRLTAIKAVKHMEEQGLLKVERSKDSPMKNNSNLYELPDLPASGKTKRSRKKEAEPVEDWPDEQIPDYVSEEDYMPEPSFP